jgi:hypothetical protein
MLPIGETRVIDDMYHSLRCGQIFAAGYVRCVYAVRVQANYRRLRKGLGCHHIAFLRKRIAFELHRRGDTECKLFENGVQGIERRCI